MKRLWELVLLLALVSVGAWAWHSQNRSLRVVIQISPFADGSHPYGLKLEGGLLQSGASSRRLSPEEVAEVSQALEAGRAWYAGNADYRASSDGVLYTEILLEQNSHVRRLSWQGNGAVEMRMIDALLQSPVGPELQATVHSAAEALQAALPPSPNRGRRRAACLRQEILLERAATSRLIPLLEFAYPKVTYIEHPTMNGFYLVGPRSSILAIKNDIPNLDQASYALPLSTSPPPPPLP